MGPLSALPTESQNRDWRWPPSGMEIRLNSKLGSRDIPWALIPTKYSGAIVTQIRRNSTLPAWFSYGLQVTLWSHKDDFGCQKRGKPGLFIQITPKTTVNHLSFAFCSFMAHCIHKNCSQYYLCSIYSIRVCNPLKYKSFPYNPCTGKSLQIFHTFLSHQQEIVLTPSMNA